MIIDISDVISCENKEITKEVQIELKSFVSRLGEFPITKAAPIELKIANCEQAAACDRRCGSERINSVQPLSEGSSDRHPFFH